MKVRPISQICYFAVQRSSSTALILLLNCWCDKNVSTQLKDRGLFSFEKSQNLSLKKPIPILWALKLFRASHMHVRCYFLFCHKRKSCPYSFSMHFENFKHNSHSSFGSSNDQNFGYFVNFDNFDDSLKVESNCQRPFNCSSIHRKTILIWISSTFIYQYYEFSSHLGINVNMIDWKTVNVLSSLMEILWFVDLMGAECWWLTNSHQVYAESLL